MTTKVQFAGTAQWSVFHELPEGTEGFIHFSHRSVDYWLEQGGPVRPLDARMFDASDAFFAQGYRSRASCIAGLPTTGIGMSNAGGTVQLQLTDNGVKMVAGSQVLQLTENGMVMTAGEQVLELGAGGLTHNGVKIGGTHKHGGVQSGESKSGTPE
ncbi:Gp138 family membrane-puncturing spike protein [Rahnella sp. PD12R]|uniref:Gp138 family membrane-puncturing spike protein n=1 Tax=Rahnella sp. PD12R TaxID=2855688 RepID=UPI00210577AA|nr:Gp138 family membrane-puncturing spike protein [Rahnella sp. PD12R]